ncbi:hypothetical protein FJTKL_13205 [Diaporthe vaccinii]|uniref:Uncharacterized protein n=1 Tax=Diaporthe vaccinii TaxID=105482 RepID=A0ABR4EBR5_9PEZI
MVHFPSASALLALAASGAAQKLNSWPKHNYGGNGRATDNDINTTEVYNIPAGGYARYALLFNSWIALSGFYIQSSGDFITDYKVEATIGPVGLFQEYYVGQVCGATGNFTYVPLVDPQDGGYVWSDTLFIEVTAAARNSSTAIINEIWPVFPGDDIVDPENTSPCPPASRRR